MSEGMNERKKAEKIKEILEDKPRKPHNSNDLDFYKDQCNLKGKLIIEKRIKFTKIRIII